MELEEAVADRLRERAWRVRANAPGAVSQEMNLFEKRAQKKLDGRNRYLDSEMKVVKIDNILQVNDRTLIRRAGRWVEADLLEKAASEPEMTIVFGTEEFSKLLDRLIAEGRQGLLAVGGDVYMELDGRRVLVRLPRP
jgi:hypothetical protein